MKKELQETIQTYNSSAEAYAKRFMEMDLYNDTYDQFLQELPKGARVLDVGCGPGSVSKYLLSQRSDLKITGIDLSAKMISLASKNVPQGDFLVLNATDLELLSGEFDGIIAGFCAPYLDNQDVAKMIQVAAQKLSKNGLLYLSAMEDLTEKSGFETTSFSGGNRVFIHYHQAEFWKQCFGENDLEVVGEDRKKYPEEDGTFLTDMIFIVQK